MRVVDRRLSISYCLWAQLRAASPHIPPPAISLLFYSLSILVARFQCYAIATSSILNVHVVGT